MSRALAWKEWREQRSVMTAGAGMAVALPLFVLAGMKAAGSRPMDPTGLADMLLALFAGILWPMFAVAAGAATFAHETGDGTLGYLLSRPAARRRIWSVKVMVAAGSTLVVVGASLIVAWAAARMAGTSGLSVEVQRLTGGATAFLAISFACVLLLLFSMSVLFSTLVSRSMTAAAGGLAVSLGMLGLLAIFWWRVDVAPRLAPGLLALQLLVLSVAALGASLNVVRRVEAPAGAGARDAGWSAILLAGAGVMAIVVALVPLARLAPEAATMWPPVPTPRGDGLVVVAADHEGYSPRLWLVHADGTGVEPLTPRLSFSPAVSPDGVWAAYVSLRGPLGLRSREGQLRVVRLDGGEDRRVASGLPVTLLYRTGSPVFSHDGTRIAIQSGSTVVAASLHDGERWSRIIEERGQLLGWTLDGTELLLLSSRQLVAVRVGAGARRVLKEGADLRTAFWWEPPAGIAEVPLQTEAGWLLVDTATGEGRSLGARICGGFGRSEDGRVLALADCGAGEVRLRVNDQLWGTWTGRFARIHLSPSGDRVAVQVMEGPGIMAPVRIVGATGEVTTFERGWSSLGWSGRHHILMMHEGAENRLALGDAQTGQLKEL